MGRVWDYFVDRLADGPMHLTLIDPDKSPGAAAARVARDAVDLGSDAVMLGGSTGISRARMSEAARAVKSSVSVPVIIFPEGPDSLTDSADAVYFMSLLNSRNLDLVIRAHARAAEPIRAMGLEAISLGYVVIAPGMRVGEVGEVDAVGREDLALAKGYALAAELLGMHLVYLEAGSGAPAPVPVPMVRAVRSVLSVPLIVGGGIRTREDAAALLDAGAQLLVTGTVAEEKGVEDGLRSIVAEVKRRRGR
jgi:phosphoglycerol geranylgeranyltransferase